jgi:hypothetical protein
MHTALISKIFSHGKPLTLDSSKNKYWVQKNVPSPIDATEYMLSQQKKAPLMHFLEGRAMELRDVQVTHQLPYMLLICSRRAVDQLSLQFLTHS